eukprot:10598649-Ditylum_brightwellii.AAC.1
MIQHKSQPSDLSDNDKRLSTLGTSGKQQQKEEKAFVKHFKRKNESKAKATIKKTTSQKKIPPKTALQKKTSPKTTPQKKTPPNNIRAKPPEKKRETPQK